MLYLLTTADAKLVRAAVGEIIGPKMGDLIKPITFNEFHANFPTLQPGDVMLCLGAKCFESLKHNGILPKNKGLGAQRQKAFKFGEGQLMVSYDPFMCKVNPANHQALLIDTMLAIRLAETGTLKPKVGSYRWVDDLSDCIDYIEKNYEGNRLPVEIDLETVGLDPYAPGVYIVSFFVSYQDGKSDGVYFASSSAAQQPAIKSADGNHMISRKELYAQLNYILNSEKITLGGANLKFDLGWLREHWGLTTSNFFFDSTIAGSLDNENGSNSLNNHAKMYTTMGGYDDEFNEKYDKSRMDLIPLDDLLIYAGGDTDATRRVRQHYTSILTGKNKTRFKGKPKNVQIELARNLKRMRKFYTEILQPANMAFHEMEHVGIHVDQDYMNELDSELTEEIKELEQTAIDLIPNMIKRHPDHAGKLKLTRSALIRDYLFTDRGIGFKPKMVTEKTKEATTDKKHLQMFLGQDEDADRFLNAYFDHAAASKTRSTFVRGFMKFLRADGKLHPTATLYKGTIGETSTESGTATGRLVFSAPSFMTLPKHTKWAKRLRKAYIAPPGYSVVNFDYSAGELRVAAVVANELNMIDAFNQGKDLHMLTGCHLSGIDYDEGVRMKKSGSEVEKSRIGRLRQGAKAANFGLLYGMSANGYRIYAKDGYGVAMTADQAEFERHQFLNVIYPGLTSWHEDFIEYAHIHEYTTSPLGRMRNLPLINTSNNSERAKAERQCINSPIQSCLSDMSVWSLVEFQRQYGNPLECQFFAMCHDAITAYVRTDELDTWIPRVKNIMENLPFDRVGWQPPITFATDAEVGPSMGELVEL